MFCLILFLLFCSFQQLIFGLSQPDPFIIGGEDAINKQHSFMVSIFRCSGNNCKGAGMCDKFVCGGTLIHPQWVLTAAHCYTQGLPVSFYQAVVGDYKITSEYESTEFRAEVEDFIIHEDFVYTQDDIKNDIALIKLKSPVPDDRMQCLYMNRQNNQIERYNCRMYGWGQYEKYPNPNTCKVMETLKYLEVGLIYTGVCRTDYEDKGWTIYDSNICSGVLDDDNENAVGGQGACFGDSGGGLHCENTQTGGWELVGVTSWGNEVCAMKHKPTVYSRVTSFLPWIFGKCSECKAIQNSGRCFQTLEDPPITTTTTTTRTTMETSTEGCHGGDYCCSIENKCDVGEGDCIKDEECKDDLVCGDCLGLPSSEDCCQIGDMTGCPRYHNMPHGVWNCPGDDSDIIGQNHVCRLTCINGHNGGYGGYVFCLGHGIWDDKELLGCD